MEKKRKENSIFTADEMLVTRCGGTDKTENVLPSYFLNMKILGLIHRFKTSFNSRRPVNFLNSFRNDSGIKYAI